MRVAILANRYLWRFLAISLVLHLALFLGVDVEPPARPVRSLPGSLKAILSVSEGKVQAPTKPNAEPDRRQAIQPKALNPEAEGRGRQIFTEAPVSATERILQPRKTALGATQGGYAETSRDAAMSSSRQEGASLDAIRQYVLLLVPEARRHKRYPEFARERGWEGTAEVSVKLSRMQNLPSMGISRTSGFPVLDEQALVIIGEAVRTVAVPELLRGKEISILVPVRFSLDD